MQGVSALSDLMRGSMRKVLSCGAGAAIGLLAMSASASPPTESGIPAQRVVPKAMETPILGSCDPGRTRHVASKSTDLQTSSMDYVAAPQSSVGFQQQADGCVIVYFSGVVFAPGARAVARRILLRAVLEGAGAELIATPSDVQLSGDDDENFNGVGARAHSMIFVFPAVNAGHYRATVQWKTPDGNTVHLHQHSLFVRHH